MKVLSLCVCFLLPFIQAAQDKKSTEYSKIYKEVSTDGTISYGSMDFKKPSEEKDIVAKKVKKLNEEYEASLKDYKDDMDEFKKSQEKDKVQPVKPLKPVFDLESRSYSGEKELKKMEEALKKKNEEAEKLNKKLEESRKK